MKSSIKARGTPAKKPARAAPPAQRSRAAAPADGRQERRPFAAKITPAKRKAEAKKTRTDSARSNRARRAPEAIDHVIPAPAIVVLDPKSISPSRWTCRLIEPPRDKAFSALCADLYEAGGNTVPIKVRPAGVGASNTSPKPTAQYEIVYGHRRHRACLQMGLPIKAIVEIVDDRRLVEEMLAECSHRNELSAYETGLLYKRLLDDGLYPSMRRLAASVRRDVSDVSRAITLATLPPALIEAMTTPRELALHDAERFTAALLKGPERAIDIATTLARTQGEVHPKVLLRAITANPDPIVERDSELEVTPLLAHDRQVGQFSIAANGAVSMTLLPGLPRHHLSALLSQIQRCLKSPVR